MRLIMNHKAEQYADWKVESHNARDGEAGVTVTLVPVDDSIEQNVLHVTLSETEAQQFPVNAKVKIEMEVV